MITCTALGNVAPAVRYNLRSNEENSTDITAVWLLQLAELAGEGTCDYVVQ